MTRFSSRRGGSRTGNQTGGKIDARCGYCRWISAEFGNLDPPPVLQHGQSFGAYLNLLGEQSNSPVQTQFYRH